MRMKDRIHDGDRMTLPSDDEVLLRVNEGWRLAAVVWERDAEADAAPRRPSTGSGAIRVAGSPGLRAPGGRYSRKRK